MYTEEIKRLSLDLFKLNIYNHAVTVGKEIIEMLNDEQRDLESFIRLSGKL